MKIKKNNSLLFIGDSITDCGRVRPIGKADGLGNGYVNLINGLIWSAYPEKRIKILNAGNSGDRVIDLAARWNEDVVKLKTNWLSIMIGINDVWRHFDNLNTVIQVDKLKFKEIYIKLIESSIKKIDGLILMSPFYIEKNKNDPMRKMMDEYGEIVKELSEEYKVIFVDTQNGFDKYLEFNPTHSLSDDRVHPNIIGHMIIANCFLKGIEFEWK